MITVSLMSSGKTLQSDVCVPMSEHSALAKGYATAVEKMLKDMMLRAEKIEGEVTVNIHVH